MSASGVRMVRILVNPAPLQESSREDRHGCRSNQRRRRKKGYLFAISDDVQSVPRELIGSCEEGTFVLGSL